jgi:hypothetical protein
MRIRTFLALSALATGSFFPLHGGSAFATESEVKKDELRSGSITTERTKEETLATCMALWDPTTHMTKNLWRTVCKRIETRNN